MTTVLVGDDIDDDARLLEALRAAAGTPRARLATREALRVIRAEHPDLVLMDIILGFSEILLAEAPAGDPRPAISGKSTRQRRPRSTEFAGRNEVAGGARRMRYMPMTLLDGRLANAAGRAVVCALVLTLSTLNSWADEKASASATGDASIQEQSSVVELKKMSVEDLMRVEVTTISRRESTIGQSPAAVSVITQEDIRRSGATTFPELFRRVPGMDVARIDNNKWAVSVRGLNDRYQRFLLVQVDGRTVYSATFAGVYWDALDYPLEDIERIEVIRGPGASVWGANAVNGIINIITKSAKDTQGGLASGGGGSEERGFGTIRYGGNITDDLSYRAYGKGFRRDEQFSETGNPNDGWWGASGGLRLDWLASGPNAVTFDAGYLRSEAGRRDSRPMISAPFVFTNIEAEVSNAPHVLARWSHKVDEESVWSLQVYWDRFIRIFQNLDVYQRWDTYDVDFQHQFPFGDRNKVVWALGYRVVDSHLGNSGHDNGFILSYLPNDSRQRLYSTLVQDQISLVEDKLELTLGSKFEHNDFTGFEAQPTTRLLWTPTKRQSIWAAASRAVRTPSVADDELRSTLLQSTPGVGPFPQTTGNPEMESEELLAFELGYRAQAADSLSVDVALFDNVYDKLRVQVPGMVFTNSLGAAIRPQLRDNGMNGTTYGTEVAATWQVTNWWRLYGAYTWLETQLHRDEGIPASQEAPEKQSPGQQVYLQSSWNLPGQVEFDVMGRFVDQLGGFNPSGAPGVIDTIDRYLSVDVRSSWRPSRDLELVIGGQNLLDNHHPEYGTSAAVRSPLVEAERGVYGKVTWRF